MVAKNMLDDILALPVQDRLELFDRLRENLLNDPDLDQLTDKEKYILDERLREYEADPESGSPWEEVEARLTTLFKDRP